MSHTSGTNKTPKKATGGKKVKPFTPLPSLGHDYDISSTNLAELKVRERMAYALLAALALASLFATAYGIHVGEFNGLQAVWNVASPILGGVVGYFFRNLKS